MKASPAAQRSLLDLQTVDTNVSRVAHRKNNLPEIAAIAALVVDRDALRGRLATELGAVEDARTDLSRIESDVAVVDSRIKRDTERLAGSSSAKDATALESELVSLSRRKENLEDAELEVMERLEAAEAVYGETAASDTSLSARIAELEATRDAGRADLDRELEALEASRSSLVSTIDESLLTAYERSRTRSGYGAALLRAGTCGACTMTLTGNDLATVRSAVSDEVLSCPECGAVLVRTEESGL
ncbi:zinc ribbon domain-containing protein [Labedella endophytica]|uniref:DNA-binding protein n=1 Tax=Labedella endophytica TaxID=1523160 RepID=A0A433JR30_9MICO|nr:C4-type zinc ribbon domain-containing protein [Labedella endophytica]RUR00788.1 DNA-binding protein [Labedella endophytica]